MWDAFWQMSGRDRPIGGMGVPLRLPLAVMHLHYHTFLPYGDEADFRLFARLIGTMDEAWIAEEMERLDEKTRQNSKGHRETFPDTPCLGGRRL